MRLRAQAPSFLILGLSLYTIYNKMRDFLYLYGVNVLRRIQEYFYPTPHVYHYYDEYVAFGRYPESLV